MRWLSAFWESVNGYLVRKGLMLKHGTILDATIIADPAQPRTAPVLATPKCIKHRKGIGGRELR